MDIIDYALQDQCEVKRHYWVHVLRRVLAVICTLAERGLAVRGSDEKFGAQNNGNYLVLLGIVVKFDPFLSTHIEKHHGNKGSGSTSSSSESICGEVIQLMAKKVSI